MAGVTGWAISSYRLYSEPDPLPSSSDDHRHSHRHEHTKTDRAETDLLHRRDSQLSVKLGPGFGGSRLPPGHKCPCLVSPMNVADGGHYNRQHEVDQKPDGNSKTTKLQHDFVINQRKQTWLDSHPDY